jgi:hypothetical protein
VLVVIGCEINDPDDRNHYLAFRVKEEIPQGLRPEEYVRDVRRQGGFGIIAHPAEKRNFSDAYPPYPWTAWDVDGFDGIEIWNQLSEWMEGITRQNLYWRILHPLRSIRYPVWATLDRWDRFNRNRRVVGVGGIDVHAYHLRFLGLFPLEIYPYKVQFRSIRSHLLLDRPLREDGLPIPFPQAEETVFRALGSGRCFVSNHSVGDGRGFRFWAEQDSRIQTIGDRIAEGGEWTFRVRSPLHGRICLLRDGRIVECRDSDSLEHRSVKPGVYRVEIIRKQRGWIYSNPIVVTHG